MIALHVKLVHKRVFLDPEPMKIDKPPAEPITSHCVTTTTNDADMVSLDGNPPTPGKGLFMLNATWRRS